MTNDKEKEQFRKDFNTRFEKVNYNPIINAHNKEVFEFLWLHIEEREKRISHLESIIQAADEFINLTKEMGIHYHDDGLLEALEKYNELKTK